MLIFQKVQTVEVFNQLLYNTDGLIFLMMTWSLWSRYGSVLLENFLFVYVVDLFVNPWKAKFYCVIGGHLQHIVCVGIITYTSNYLHLDRMKSSIDK